LRENERKSSKEQMMTWTTPQLVEIPVGMEVTSYQSAQN
jgi:coenzyme PQQ precursor peptide PqqA